jgi:hypothetical protein
LIQRAETSLLHQQINGAWIGAPKTTWGKDIIEKIDKIILDHRQTPEYLKYYEDWIYEDNIPDYRRIVKNVYENE